ncbi:MAG: glutamine-hydrolyzing carbamoyl-phosphate synthase small subunit [Saprospiraceae bacterium]|jgi:carbamoyl-phosphate synthase small subunit|nr:glutamine-hydrolyzing carbamoyl-phosphate synthase small subunit [Saprospiraceae bacterium]MBP9209270.1 glutamine-hydrolyzing carbamoyl-phosphate synthase small subunit [Saprospiraceae bacterium]
MAATARKRAYLLMDDGSYFEGWAAGKSGTIGGEICFNTSMTGYQEIYTDPSYYGQIMVNTNVHIGNYGVMQAESESDKAQIRGLVCRNFSAHMSRQIASESLDAFLETHGVLCIYGLDTRAIVRHIRIHGAMNAVISTELDQKSQLRSFLASIPSMEGLELATQVTTRAPYPYGNADAAFRLAVVDYGIKQSILGQLDAAGFYMQVFPANAGFEVMERWNPDAYFLSNGPGDPMAMQYAISDASDIIRSGKPVFGICLGHQLLSIAMGVQTFKMHHGHRGANHPVLNLQTKLGEITSQNHGFAVDAGMLEKHKDEIILTHINLNDGSVEGFHHRKRPVCGVQYHPEAGPGPHDSRYLFHQFYQNLHREHQTSTPNS